MIHCVKDETVTQVIIQPTLHSTAEMHEHVDDLVQYDVIFNLYTEKKKIYGNMLCHNKFNFIIIKTSFVLNSSFILI